MDPLPPIMANRPAGTATPEKGRAVACRRLH